MRKIIFLSILILTVWLFAKPVSFANAQMMGEFNYQIDQKEIGQTQKDEQAGKQVYDLLKSGKTDCSKLKDDDFEKLGEYFMGQMAGSSQNHTYMDKMMGSYMGTDEEQYHTEMGKIQSGCYSADGSASYNFKGGELPMMGYGGYPNMMGGFGFGSSFAIFGFIMWITVWAVLVLLAIYLWQKIKNPKK